MLSIDEAKGMLQAKLTCMELSDKACFSAEEGCNRDCDSCEYMYGQGTWGEHKKALEMAIKALEELKEARKGFNENRKAGYKHGYSDGYNKAIDDFAERLKQEYEPCKAEDNYIYQRVCSRIEEVAQQLKEGAVDGNSTTDN